VANYQLTENAIVYASYSTGYKSGGFDSFEVATAELPITPEDITNVELGVKGDFLDSRLRVQLSLYDMSVEGSQRTILGQRPQDAGLIYYIINGDTDNKGAELQVDWLATSTLKLGISTSYARNSSEFDDYYNALSELVVAQEVKTNTSFADNYIAKLDWYPETDLGSVRVHLDYVFNADTLKGTPDYLVDFANVPGYGSDRKSLNVNIAWNNAADNIEVSLWGKNLTDNERVADIGGLGINTINTPLARIDELRTYGVQMQYSF